MSIERFLSPPPGTDWNPVALALGSNLGRRRDHLSDAVRSLGAGPLFGLHCSSVYETEPAYDTDQPRFLNACCVGWTRLSPLALLDTLKVLEHNAGRDLHGRRFGPRELDLDILLYGDEVVQTDRLTVPHQGLPDRAFVLVPLAEIAGAWTHPQLGVSIADLAAAADPSGVRATNLRLEVG